MREPVLDLRMYLLRRSWAGAQRGALYRGPLNPAGATVCSVLLRPCSVLIELTLTGVRYWSRSATLCSWVDTLIFFRTSRNSHSLLFNTRLALPNPT